MSMQYIELVKDGKHWRVLNKAALNLSISLQVTKLYTGVIMVQEYQCIQFKMLKISVLESFLQ